MHLYDFMYSYQLIIIYTQLYGLKKLFLFNNHLFAHIYGFKYFNQIQIIHISLYIYESKYSN